MQARGKFIVVEGLEGAGKSTAIHTLLNILAEASIKAITTREPGGTSIGESLRSLIKNPDFKGVLEDKTELLLFYAARMQLVQEVIKPALAAGIWVIADRFELSTFAYQGGGRGLDRQVLQVLSQFCLDGFKPDCTFFLDIPPELGLERAGKRGDLDRIEQQSLDFFHKVDAGYKQNLGYYPQVIVIDAAAPLDAVQAAITKSMQHYLMTQT
jgi:dTMP kinase